MHYPGADSYVLLTRPLRVRRTVRVQLACVRHAASVNPEPESNSPLLRFNGPGDHRILGFTGGRGRLFTPTPGVFIGVFDAVGVGW